MSRRALLTLEWLVILVLAVTAIVLAVQLDDGLNDAKRQYVQLTCDEARTLTHDFTACHSAQATTRTEYLCDHAYGHCWVEVK